jgi:hypothetical protein
MTDSPVPSNSNPQILQNVTGNQNLPIGMMQGGFVVYVSGGQAIINPPNTDTAAEGKTKDPQIGANPYKGLRAFQETDCDRFFGRTSQIDDLWDKFRSLHEDESATRLLTIYGSSGSGKSSLARAGLIPKLDRQPLQGLDRARVAVLMPKEYPLRALATVLAQIAMNAPAPEKAAEVERVLMKMNEDGQYEGLSRIALALPEIEVSPLIVLVDQLEEVFTRCEDKGVREAFIGNLLHATADRSRHVAAIVTLRSDFLGAAQKYPRFEQLIQPQGFFVAAMDEAGLREAISKPAELAGHSFDLSTVNLSIEQTKGREGALPLVQFALEQIWVGLQNGKEPAETLESIGGVGGALAGKAQKIYENLDSTEREIARRVFLGLVQLGEGAKDTRRRTELTRLVSHRDSLQQVRDVTSKFAHQNTRLITLADD